MPNSAKNEISSFVFNTVTIRAINKDNDIWFVAKDVCDVLEIQNITQALQSLDDDEYSMFNIGKSERGNPNVNIINESGLYALVLKSRKPEAKKFRKWVTSEVLPSIRKTGSYTQTINLEQQGELSTLIAERFPEGNKRPYAWSRFNNHFRLSSYKHLPASKFKEACEYIRQMPVKQPNQRFIMEVKDGKVELNDIQSFYQGLPQFIESTVCPLEDGLVVRISKACIENLEYRAGSRLYQRDKAREELKRLGGAE